jgi:SulP family sulfate permease
MNILKRFLPILSWLPGYKSQFLPGDLSAGLTVGVMLIPQGMAYAMIAGLPPVYGLYAAMIPQIIYAIFGTSRQLAVGPVAMDSLLVAAGISMFAVSGTDQYIALALLLALLMGLMQFAFGILRLGFLVNFLSRPVISGFTSAAALIIGINQLKYLIGVDLERGNNIFIILYDAVLSYADISWLTVIIGVGGIIILKNAKKVHKAIPGALVVVALGIIIVWLFGLDEQGVSIVGVVPKGMPQFALPDINSAYLTDLLPAALTLSLIAFMEAISVAKALQSKHKSEYQIQPNQELIGLGLANIVGSMFGSYPTTGGFSRSAVNEQSGAKTNLAAIISAGLIALTLLFLTPLFYYLPKAILASVIMVAVFGLIDFKLPGYLWKTRKEDFYMLLTAFVVTLAIGIKEGILISVAMSLVAMIYRSTKPHYAVLGKLPQATEYRNVERFPEVEIFPEALIIRYDAELYFANANHFVESVKKEIAKKGDSLRLVIIHGGSMAHIDSTGYQALVDLILDLEKEEIRLILTNLIGPTRDFLLRAEFDEQVGPNRRYNDIQSGIDEFRLINMNAD